MTEQRPVLELNLSSFMTLLTILFIGLKLAKVIDWSWWLVLSPLYVPILLVYLCLGVIWLIAWLLYRKNGNIRKFW